MGAVGQGPPRPPQFGDPGWEARCWAPTLTSSRPLCAPWGDPSGMSWVSQGCGHPEVRRGVRAETCGPRPSPELQYQPEHQILTEAEEELKITLPPRELTQIRPAPKLGWTQTPSQHVTGAESSPFSSSRLLCLPDAS